MISVEKALLLIKKHFPDVGYQEADVNICDTGITSEELTADRDYPPFNRVMMDGIALSYKAFSQGMRSFKIEGIAPAGNPPLTLKNVSSCIEVMTGAPLPNGTDLVIPYEHLELKNELALIVKDENRNPMENVHLKGSDAKEGDVILSLGSQLTGPSWGIAASLGYARLKVKKKPSINIISTGDELVDVSIKPQSHQIRRSNIYALMGSLKQFGFRRIESSHLADNIDAIESHFTTAKDKFDILIYSGGVSKGKYDFLPETLKRLGVTEIFHGISQRPGKPMWFGIDQNSKTVVFGLPGNPVSSLVCLHKYVLDYSEIYAELSEDITFKKDLTYFLPVKLLYSRDGKIKAVPIKIQNSGEFSALAGSDGFIELPREQSNFKAGECFRFHPWRPM